MSYAKIVFTGGPCAGKTTQLNKLKEYLKNKNIENFYISETATDIFGIGIRYDLINDTSDFQKMILEFQKLKEDSVDFMLEKNKNSNKKFITVCDRGILDNKAYFENVKEFDKLLKKYNYNELEFIDSYDLVIDLVTLADCNPKMYNLSSNEARNESPSEAISRDRRTSNAWAGHRNITVINTCLNENEIFEIIKNKIINLVNGYTEKEINKLELDNDIFDFYEYNDKNSRLIDIKEITLDIKEKDVCCKLYKRTYKDYSTYILNISYLKDNKEVTIKDEKINLGMYKKMLSKYKPKEELNYKQLSFIENRQEYNVKFYNDKTILEYEENKLNKEFILPSCAKIKEKQINKEYILNKINLIMENNLKIC